MVSIWGRLKKYSYIVRKKWSVLGLASEWKFEKGDRKSYNGSSESEYKSKSS